MAVLAGANQLIPMELALKVASKIRAGQRFAVYIVIPMWPEGVPDSAAMQEMLYFQVTLLHPMAHILSHVLFSSYFYRITSLGNTFKCYMIDFGPFI